MAAREITRQEEARRIKAMTDLQLDCFIRERLTIEGVDPVSTSIGAAFNMLADNFPDGSHAITLDNCWREVDGERISGWTCRIVGPGCEGEATAGTPARGIAEAAALASVSDPRACIKVDVPSDLLREKR